MTLIRHRVLAVALAGSTLFGAATIVATPAAEAQPAEQGERAAEDRHAANLERLRERLADAVASGRITQDRADEMLERFSERAARFAERRAEFDGDREGLRAEFEARRAERQAERESRATALAEVLGTTTDDLKQSIKNGESLADIADANGVDVQAVIDHLVDSANDRIDTAVDAGRLDADRAAELRTRVEDHIDAVVHGERERRGPGNGHAFGREGRGDRGERGAPSGD